MAKTASSPVSPVSQPVPAASQPTSEVSPIADKPKDEIMLLREENAHYRKMNSGLKSGNLKTVQKVKELEMRLKEAQLPKEALDSSVESVTSPLAPVVAIASVASPTPSSKKNRSWPLPYCPGPEWCGDPEHHTKGARNSDFPDEVACVDCHAPLGAEVDVKHHMESCPMCQSDRGYVARPGYELKHDRCEGEKCSVKA